MSRIDPQVEQLVVEITRQVIEVEAPEEMPLVDAFVKGFLESPNPPDHQEEDDPLSFGVGEAVASLTPAVVAMVTAVVTPLLKDAAVTIKDAGMEALRDFIKDRMSQKEEKGGKALAFAEPEQLEQIRKEALVVALEWRVSPEKARRMADVLVGRLAVLGT